MKLLTVPMSKGIPVLIVGKTAFVLSIRMSCNLVVSKKQHNPMVRLKAINYLLVYNIFILFSSLKCIDGQNYTLLFRYEVDGKAYIWDNARYALIP